MHKTTEQTVQHFHVKHHFLAKHLQFYSTFILFFMHYSSNCGWIKRGEVVGGVEGKMEGYKSIPLFGKEVNKLAK